MKTINGGIFIVLEGGEGSGKTTIAKSLVDYYTAHDYMCSYTKEPGASKVGNMIRDIVTNEDLDSLTQLLLFSASRNINTKQIIMPKLENGEIVICDRYVTSSIVYQSVLGNGDISVDDVMAIQRLVAIWPHIQITLNISAETGLKRIKENNRETNLLDRKGLVYHTNINEGYRYCHTMYKKLGLAKHGYEVDAEQDMVLVYNQCRAITDEYIKSYRQNDIKEIDSSEAVDQCLTQTTYSNL
jgi:dTMP kinase